jgi:hypothetical protein
MKKWVIIGFLLLLVLGGSVFLFFQVKLQFFDEGLRLDTYASSDHLLTPNKAKNSVLITAKIENSALCQSICSYTYEDLSNSQVVSSGKLNQKADRIFEKELLINLNETGVGEKVYSYSFECSNVVSLTCPDKHVRDNGVILVSYTLTDGEKELQLISGGRFENIETNLSLLNKTLEKARYLSTSLRHDSLIFDQIAASHDSVLADLRIATESWSYYDFEGLPETLDSLSLELVSLRSVAENYTAGLIKTAEVHNNNTRRFKAITSEGYLNKTWEFYHRNNESVVELIALIKDLNNSNTSPNFSNDTVLNKYDKMRHNYTLHSSKLFSNIRKLILQESDKYGVNLRNSSSICTHLQLFIEDAAEDVVLMNQTLMNFNRTFCGAIVPEFNFNFANHLTLVNTTLDFNTSFNLELSKSNPVCCLKNSCNSCGQHSKYPLILIHGHSFNQDNSPDYSLSSFSKIQGKLENEGYLNGGKLNLKEGLQIYNFPISYRATYYYITSLDLVGYLITTQKSERIENYAIRLKEIVEDVKKKTGKDKVVLLGHSMGGLVAREYLALFGEESVDKLIMIGSPNDGLVGKTSDFCSFFGSFKECEDMKKDSVFLKRLNAHSPPQIPLHNIVGTGCSDGASDGDGVVLKENAELKSGTNYYVEGICQSKINNFLHNSMLDPVANPKVFEIISDILNN